MIVRICSKYIINLVPKYKEPLNTSPAKRY